MFRQVVPSFYNTVTGNQEFMAGVGAEGCSIIADSQGHRRGIDASLPEEFTDSVNQPEFSDVSQSLRHSLLLACLYVEPERASSWPVRDPLGSIRPRSQQLRGRQPAPPQVHSLNLRHR